MAGGAVTATGLLLVAAVWYLSRHRPLRRRHTHRRAPRAELRIGCGAGYAGDRVLPAVELVASVDLDYIFLECLAERTLAIAHARMDSGGPGYDPRLPQWLGMLLPICAARGCKLVANLGAADPRKGAAAAAFVVGQLGLDLKVVGVGEPKAAQRHGRGGASYTYLGAETVQGALALGADVVIAGRVADPSLLVGIVAHEFGWDLGDESLADAVGAATCCGHLLECGMHLTGGFFFHPAGRCPPTPVGTAPDKTLGMSVDVPAHESITNIGMPYAVLRGSGPDSLQSGAFEVHKPPGSGGELSERTCTQQLLYEVHDLARYVTPDVVADFSGVSFQQIHRHAVGVRGARASAPRPAQLLRLTASPAGVRQCGECSFAGPGAQERSEWADRMVRAWMERESQGSSRHVLTSRPGLDALGFAAVTRGSGRGKDDGVEPAEVRLRFEGVFPDTEGALALATALGGLGVGGPAGVCAGFMQSSPYGAPATAISKSLVPRDCASWSTWQHMPGIARAAGGLAARVKGAEPRLRALAAKAAAAAEGSAVTADGGETLPPPRPYAEVHTATGTSYVLPPDPLPAKGTFPLTLYDACHSRAGDKGNTVNVSLIAYAAWAAHFDRIVAALPVDVLASAFAPLHDSAASDKLDVRVYRSRTLAAINIVMSPVLDGGVSLNRRLDIHGKSFSDLLLGLRVYI